MTNTKPGQARLKPDAETLQGENGYRKILELEFSEMIPFVLSNIRKGGVIPIFYISINVIFFFFIIIYAVWIVKTGSLNAGKIFWQIFAGVLAGSILVIPPHEILHGLAYRLLGARKIKFGMDLQQFIFYVTADRFPISKKELAILAMTPFVLINLGLIALTATWGSQFTLFSAFLLLCHNIMCIGDFAIINYAFTQKGELYTYDDIGIKKSYFFIKEE